MPSTRSEANQALYRARILLSAWDEARGAQRWPEQPLAEAFLPAVRLQLRCAYGWFLLAVSGRDDAGGGPAPLSVRDLAIPEEGRERAPELREFELLEARGWLHDMLSDDAFGTVHENAGGMLLGSDRQAPGYAVVAGWVTALAAIMQRMEDSLAEC